jgi:hypothetical protein
MARPLLVLAVLLACIATGCGNDRTRPPETQAPDPPAGERTDRYPKAGVTYTAPVNWPQLQPQGLRVGGIQSKRATLAIWRYPRSEPLPDTDAKLKEVERLLIERVKQRDPTFALERSTRRRRGGARAIELVGRQTAAGLPYGVRSSHVFFAGHEIVFDAYAPPEHFERVDETVFVPLLESLKLKKARP